MISPLTDPMNGAEDGDAETGAARARDRVFALLSHEIRTPLNGVLGMAGLLAATPLDATQAAYLSTLRDCGEHLLGLVNNMLDLAKLEAGRIELEPADTDVEALLQGVCELLSPRAHAKGLEIAWSVAPGLGVIRADDGALRQILFNLAGNAMKLTETGGVWLRAERCGGVMERPRIRFSVADSGPGLKPQDQARIFEEFAQADAGVRAGGAGLGLAIVRRLVAALEGTVGVESAPGSGAVFRVEATFDAVQGPARADDLQGLTVAVETASWVVREAAEAQVRACGGGVAEPGEPCDVRLVDAGEAIAPPPPSGAPALVLLAPEARERIEAYRSAGYAGYLIKPLRRASLAARVRAALAEEGRDDAGDERAAPARLEGLRVLLAEDNPVNALLARALLTRCGCSVMHVGGGEEALAAVRAAAYDLVLLDMRMPDLDGPATARALRAAGFRLPIVALTANAFADDRRLCLEAGMDGFLTKPLQPAALEAELARWRRASAA